MRLRERSDNRKKPFEIEKKGTKSCGCLQKEMASKSNTKHGMYKTRIYKSWADMIQRCHNKNEPNYRYCGSKGIIVCDEWKKNFVSFYNWAMSNGYKDNLTIDRINNYGNYEPANCRWITIKEQERNKKTNRILEYKGEKHSIGEWAELLNINPNTIWVRLYRGWSIERALENK